MSHGHSRVSGIQPPFGINGFEFNVFIENKALLRFVSTKTWSLRPVLRRRIFTLQLQPPALWGSAPLKLPRRSSHRRRRLCICTCFTHESNLIDPGTNHWLGAAHATEIWYTFDNVEVEGPRNAPGPQLIGTDPDRKQAALHMSEMWATFARTGHPSAKGQPSWPAYTLQKRATMMIDTQCKVEEDPFGPELALWDSLKS